MRLRGRNLAIITLITVCLVLGGGVAVFASDGDIYNADGYYVGYVSGNSICSKYSTVGYINENRIEDTNNTTVGEVSTYGTVYDSSGYTVGYIVDQRIENRWGDKVGSYEGGWKTAKAAAGLLLLLK